MNSVLKLFIASVLPSLLTVVFFEANKIKTFSKISDHSKQVIYGVFFGALAILGTEWGIPMNGAQVNCRDGAVMVAGLLFGAPAGIIAGLIGGIERWFAVYWGVGTFTRLACTVSTIIAGIYSAALRKYMFENKRPSWLLAWAVGTVMEVFHLTMVFITNLNNPVAAIGVVKVCTKPMLLSNGLAVLLSAIVFTFLSGEKLFKKHQIGKENLSQTIQKWLLISVSFAFILSSVFVHVMQNGMVNQQTDNDLSIALDDACEDLVQMNAIDYPSIADRHHIRETGFVVVYDEKGQLISSPEDISNFFIIQNISLLNNISENKNFLMDVEGEPCFARKKSVCSLSVLSVLPKEEAMRGRDIAIYVNTFVEILIFSLMFGMIYLLLAKVVVSKIKEINKSLGKIISGNLDETVDVRSNAEFVSLSDDINSTVDTLKQYIAEAAARIDKELEFAKNIQSSALPKTFPANDEYEVYATMTPAKEVGGDFYDFYATKDKVNFLIADVSGKGIPAAMFMMRAKTELKSLTESELSIGDVFTRGNNALCEGNDAGMFVTAWQGGVNLETGLMKFVNAGHNPPLVCHENGQFAYVKARSGLVLAGMEGIPYKEQELKLEKGDIVFLYTDGVTEATNLNNELFGEDRLLKTLNSQKFSSMKELCSGVRKDVDDFVGEAPQFDDITMLAIKFSGRPPLHTISFEQAKTEDINTATDFINEKLELMDCPPKVAIQLSIALDEIMSNIVKYSYYGKPGPVTINLRSSSDGKSVTMQFIDEGYAYNPLTKEDPDTTLSADERSIGGLGIFMVKKTMTDMFYEFRDNKNILTIKKDF